MAFLRKILRHSANSKRRVPRAASSSIRPFARRLRIEGLEARRLLAAFSEFVDPNPNPGNQFGDTVVPLSTGNVVITSPLDDAGGIDAGAVYLFSGSTGTLISTLKGSKNFDKVGNRGVVALSNGNYLIRSTSWDNGSARDAGAVTLGNGLSGISGTVSPSNSLVGTRNFDNLGHNSLVALKNGNYVVADSGWRDGAEPSVGAVTFGNGTTGVTGPVTASNSLIGSHAYDQVGNGGIVPLNTGNYVVRSLKWDNGNATNAGAVTFGSGTTGVTGAVSPSNSLVGVTSNDQIGNGGVVALDGGNYVVKSVVWDAGSVEDAGAATFGNGTTGVSGLISANNSLVGTTAFDQVGGRVLALDDGNYVVNSSSWSDGTVANVGAVTFGNGASGVMGLINATNSLIGTTANDLVGESVVALDGGNYVVISSRWDAGSVVDAGAVTFLSGASGITGKVTANNSLVGSSDDDRVGRNGVAALDGGSYVVKTFSWDDGAVVDAGAATFGNGSSGVSGVISASNSLVGTDNYDQVGTSVVALDGGNYVVISSGWDSGLVSNAGAVTFGNGISGISGPVTTSNSLVGSRHGDQIGNSGVVALDGGSYVVSSGNWDSGLVENAGAVTFGNGISGITGAITMNNSLVGVTANDRIGGSVVALDGGSYITSNAGWDNGSVVDAGAVTFGNRTSGVSGSVSVSNSLVGSSTNDKLSTDGTSATGNESLVALDGGNYVVGSLFWDNGSAVDSGAVIFGDATRGGAVGEVHTQNSVLGSTTNTDLQYTVVDNFNRKFYAPFVNEGGGRVKVGSQVYGFVEPSRFVVTTALDVVDSADSLLSLREAVQLANSNPGLDTITFDPSVFTDHASSMIRLSEGELEITEALTIDASLVTEVTVTGDADGNDITDAMHITNVEASGPSLLDDNSRVLNFSSSVGDLSLSGLTVTGGRTTGHNTPPETTYSGGGIRFDSNGLLTLNNSVVSGNSTTGNFAFGGGIGAFLGSVSLTNSSVNGNRTSGSRAYGGGILSDSGSIDLINSIVSANNTTGTSAFGGGIIAGSGAVSLTNSLVSENSTAGSSADGGGIFANSGSVSLDRSTVSGNSTNGTGADGGGIFTFSGSISSTNSTVSGNITKGSFAAGGGFFAFSGSINLINSTVSGNSTTSSSVAGGGGGISTVAATVILTSSTVTGNTTAAGGGGIHSSDTGSDKSLTIQNSIVAGNFDNAGTPSDLVPDPDSTITINHSLIGVADNLGTITGDVGNQTGLIATPLNPLLSPLANNGGSTQTHALQPGSPAINKGSSTEANDQRGVPFLRNIDSVVDIGAFELQEIDFGDAPAPYPTTTDKDGASHQATGPRLGAARDSENNGVPAPAADGDDLDSDDDEDGVLFGRIAAGGMAGININLQNTAAAKLDAWIDFNRDGDWDDAGEQILDSIAVPGGLQTLNYSVPSGDNSGVTFARVRVSTAGNLDPTGAASDGEVEDYAVTIGALAGNPTATINNSRLTRSEITSIEVQFDSIVEAVASDFVLLNTTTGQLVTGFSVSRDNAGDSTLATLGFSGGVGVITGDTPGQLPSLGNGFYELRYRPGTLDGSDAPIAIDNFFRKFGDDNGDNLVGLSDFAAFRGAFGSSFVAQNPNNGFNSGLDANRDGTIGLSDFAAFRGGFGT